MLNGKVFFGSGCRKAVPGRLRGTSSFYSCFYWLTGEPIVLYGGDRCRAHRLVSCESDSEDETCIDHPDSHGAACRRRLHLLCHRRLYQRELPHYLFSDRIYALRCVNRCGARAEFLEGNQEQAGPGEWLTMPVYEYQCLECGEKFEALVLNQRLADEQKCPHCGSGKVSKLFSVFGSSSSGGGSSSCSGFS